MRIIDWIEKNIDTLIEEGDKLNGRWILTGSGMGNIKPNTPEPPKVSTHISGEDLLRYEEEIKELDEFKGMNIIIPISPRIEIVKNGMVTYHTVGDVEIRIVDLPEEEKNLTWLFNQYKDEADFLYLYGIRVYRNMHTLGLRYTFIRNEDYAKNLKRTELIDELYKKIKK